MICFEKSLRAYSDVWDILTDYICRPKFNRKFAIATRTMITIFTKKKI